MNMWSALVLIVLIAVVAKIAMNRQQRGEGPAAPHVDSEKAALRREVEELRQRIATLETIATDRAGRLSQEIDALNAPKEEGKD
ncbi:MAG: hypothetical protein AAF205_09390 [Pseudomonadota bacterium]